MSSEILSKENTKVFEQLVSNHLFISVQNETEAKSILVKADDLLPSLIEEMKASLNATICKVIGKQNDFSMIKSALNMIFDDVKFVERESEYTVHFEPSPIVLRASKSSIVQNKIVPTKPKIVKVLVVDDSTTICNLLTKIMGLSPDIEVVGTINDPLDAEEAIKKFSPDVMTLDIHMPNMNGVELLQKIYPKYHIPTIMISSISMKEGPLVLEALESGAVDYIQKPDMSNFAAIAAEINNKIIQASKVESKVIKKKAFTPIASSQGVGLDDNLIVIGASTGGTKALKELLDKMPDHIPPILIVQHIPAEFSKAFADRLNTSVKFLVKEATHGDIVKANQVLIAPGGTQMKFKNRSGHMTIEINDDAPVNRFKPSVDYLFDSVANSSIDLNIVAAIFTGMGRDGADGMRRLKNMKQAKTIAQNEESSVVFGMPKEAIKLGCVDHIVPLEEAAKMIMDSCVGTESIKKAQ